MRHVTVEGDDTGLGDVTGFDDVTGLKTGAKPRLSTPRLPEGTVGWEGRFEAQCTAHGGEVLWCTEW